MMEQDYLLRQIHMLMEGIARIFFHREAERYAFPDDAASDTLADQWYRAVLKRLDAGDIGGAENLLFEELQPGDASRLAAALDFYGRLEEMDGAALDAGGFSREEILQGLEDVAALYGINLAGK
jgi:hypothetical protein